MIMVDAGGFEPQIDKMIYRNSKTKIAQHDI